MFRSAALCAAALVMIFAAQGSAQGSASGDTPQRETIDRIIAVVGDKVILASELASQMQLAALQGGKQPRTQADVEKLQQEVLDQMISDQLFLIAAEQDTTIKVRDDEVNQALDEHIARVAGNFDSNEQFEAALAAEGLTVRDLKKRYRDDIKGQILKQRFIGRKLQSVSVSRHEVEEFFNNYQDSIPAQPEAVKLAHILLEVKPSQQVEDSVRDEAADLRQRVLDGADFATISSQYSSGGSGANGGDLGWVSRDDVVEEFARAAFNLNKGDISGVIRTQFGYHVIKCEGRQGDRSHLRHILLAVTPTHDDTVRTERLADSLLTLARDGQDFAQLAKAFSDDNNTRARGGELGWFAIKDMPQEFAAAVRGWKTPGEFKGPIGSQYGLHILELLDYQSERKYSLDEDYDKIKDMARQEKTAKLIEDWINDFKTKTYVDIRPEDVQ